jgi:hypothetical protein
MKIQLNCTKNNPNKTSKNLVKKLLKSSSHEGMRILVSTVHSVADMLILEIIF